MPYYRSENTNSGEGCGIIIVGIMIWGILGAIFGAIKDLIITIQNYSDLNIPYSIFAACYNYILIVPVQFSSSIFRFITQPGITPWPNLNGLLAIIAVILYYIGIIVIISKFMAILHVRTGGNFTITIFVMILLAPAILALLWYLGSNFFLWLFSPA